jgi:hypothetical protein
MTRRPMLSTDPDAWLTGRASPMAEWGGENFAKPRARRGAPEAQIQRAIVDRLRWLGVLAVAVPNEGKRTAVTGRALKGNGLRPGFPDLICMQAGRVAFLEVKAPAGVVSGPQAAMHAELERQGMRVAVVRSQEEAVASLKRWGFVV